MVVSPAYRQTSLQFEYLKLVWENSYKTSQNSLDILLGTSTQPTLELLPMPSLNEKELDLSQKKSSLQEVSIIQNQLNNTNEKLSTVASKPNLSANLRVDNRNNMNYYIGINFRTKIGNWLTLNYNNDYDMSTNILRNNFTLNLFKTLSSEPWFSQPTLTQQNQMNDFDSQIDTYNLNLKMASIRKEISSNRIDMLTSLYYDNPNPELLLSILSEKINFLENSYTEYLTSINILGLTMQIDSYFTDNLSYYLENI